MQNPKAKQSAEIVPLNQNQVPALPPGANYFTQYGESVRSTAIVGKLLKFSKGDWVAGEENADVEEGTQFIANMDQLLVGWVRWQDLKPTDHVMGTVASGYQPPRRDTLGDTDQDLWETNEDGESRDPWQLTNYLLLQAVDGDELYTFTTSSRGGLNAIGDLSRKYGKLMRHHADEFPVIQIGVGSYMHSNKEYGRIKFPTLEVVGWVKKDSFVDYETATDDESRGEEADGAQDGVEEVTQPEPAPQPQREKPIRRRDEAVSNAQLQASGKHGNVRPNVKADTTRRDPQKTSLGKSAQAPAKGKAKTRF